tara:strand:+ start:680 stop:859 length:180 start_codon:yes stop_codon:yes gene_type:complete
MSLSFIINQKKDYEIKSFYKNLGWLPITKKLYDLKQASKIVRLLNKGTSSLLYKFERTF